MAHGERASRLENQKQHHGWMMGRRGLVSKRILPTLDVALRSSRESKRVASKRERQRDQELIRRELDE